MIQPLEHFEELREVVLHAAHNWKTDDKWSLLLQQINNVCEQLLIKWKNVKVELPEEGNRYWCYCQEVNDLGISHFQWNCYYDVKANEWRDNHKTFNVTHWRELMSPPKI